MFPPHPFPDLPTPASSRLAHDPIALFRVLPAQDYINITRQLLIYHAPVRTVIISENDTSNDVHFVLSGRVAVKSFSATGHEVSYMEIGAGAMFGEFAALDDQPRSATVEAIEQTRLARMDATQFRNCLLQYPALSLELSKCLVKKVRTLTERVFEFSTLPVNIRVRLELLRLARAFPSVDDSCILSPAPSHQEIAARISTHREAVSREISMLTRAGYISTARRTIHIRSILRLRQHAGLPGK